MTTESVSQLSSTLVSYVLEPAIRSGGLVIATCLLVFAIRIRDIAAKLTIWTLVLYVSLAMPLLVALLPALSFSLGRPTPDASTSVTMPTLTQTGTEALPIRGDSTPVDGVPTTLENVPSGPSIDWRIVASVLYMFIVAIMLGRFVVGLFLSRRLLRASQPVTDAQATAILREVAIGKMPKVNLAESEALTVPITLTLRRSIILLPTNWREWETQKLRAVLAHEMAHVARKDARVQMLSALHRCFFWFSPASWWLHRRIAETAEQAADNRALEVVSDRTYYAEVLLGFFEALRATPRRVRGIEVSMARGSAAERRLDGVLSDSCGLPLGIRRVVLAGAFLVILPIVYLAATLRPHVQDKAVAAPEQPVESNQGYKRASPETDLALEIVLPNESNARTLRIRAGRTMKTIVRDQLSISNPEAATGLTGLDIWADREDDSIRLRLSVLYSDLSNPDWWKDKKEKILESYVIRKGESVQPAQLAEFGLAPVEFKAMQAELIVFKRGEGPPIINKTRSLEVIKLEKSLDTYYLSLRNVSDKNVVSFAIAHSDMPGGLVPPLGAQVGSFGGSSAAIVAGGDFNRLELNGQRVETGGIRIEDAVFGDRTFEGDAFAAAYYLAQDDGAKIAAPVVLRLVEQALKADDSQLQRAVDKLDSRLRAIPEPIAPGESLEVFRARFSSFDDKTVMQLYKVLYLSFGPHFVREHVLYLILDLKRDIERARNEAVSDQLNGNWKAQRIRRTLTDAKEFLERVSANR